MTAFLAALMLASQVTPGPAPWPLFRLDINFGAECARDDGPYADWCRGYILGVADAFAVQRVVCFSNSVTGAQVQAVVRRYLSEHPELWDRHGFWLIHRALSPAFPCPAR